MGTANKRSWLLTPIPTLIREFFGIKPKEKPATTSTRSRDRKFLIVFGVLSYLAFWIFEGCVNPLTLLVDLPINDTSLYGDFMFFYYVPVLLIAAIIVKVLHLFVHTDDPSLFSVNGLLMCVTGAGVGLASDTAAQLLMDTVVIPNADAHRHVMWILIAYAMLFFVIHETTATAIAIELVPFLFSVYSALIPKFPLLDLKIVRQLIITFALSLLMSLIDETGLIDRLSKALLYLYCPLATIFIVFLLFFA